MRDLTTPEHRPSRERPPASAPRAGTSAFGTVSPPWRRLRTPTRAPLPLCAAFAVFVVYAGRPTGVVAELLLLTLAVGLWSPRMALPRNGSALLALALLSVVAVQVAFDLFTSDVGVVQLARGLAAVYYVLFAFLIYAGMREWERRASRQEVFHRVERALVAWAPFLVTACFGLTVLATAGPQWTSQYALAKPLRSIGQDLIPMVVVLFPVIQRGLKESGRPLWRVLLVMWAVTALILVFRSRTAALAVFAVVLVVGPRPKRLVGATLAAVSVLLVLYVSGLSFNIRDREISFDGAVASVTSLVGAGESSEHGSAYVGTRDWRAEWWGDIVSDIRAQPFVLHGYGWDENLGRRYDIVVYGDDGEPFYAEFPHSIVLSLAARGGLVVAGLFVATAATTLVRALRRCGGASRSFLIEAVLYGFVAALTTSLVETTLDKPQVAVLFWCLAGFLWWASAPPSDEASADAGVPTTTVRAGGTASP